MTLFTGRNLVCVRGERHVFAGLDFAVDAGGALVLAGANGSGKSSLLRLMAGLLRPASGALAWDGAATAADPEAHRARLHYVGHLDAVKPVLTVAENLRFWDGLRPRRRAGNPRDSVGPALETFGIAHLADVPGRFLSAGQKRRLTLARIVTASAPLWLLDEPTTALDESATASLEAAIAGHRAGGGMAVVATHTRMAMDGARVLDLSGFAVRSQGAGEPGS